MLLEHLRERHLDCNLHKVFLDEVEGVVTLPLYNLSGYMVGYQQYRPGASKEYDNCPRMGRYFTYRNKNTLALWGLESWYLSPSLLFVCEGVFDACRFTKLGYSAVAILTNNPPLEVGNWLNSFGKTVVVVADDDKAGNKLKKLSKYSASSAPFKDMGEATDEFVLELVNLYDER